MNILHAMRLLSTKHLTFEVVVAMNQKVAIRSLNFNIPLTYLHVETSRTQYTVSIRPLGLQVQQGTTGIRIMTTSLPFQHALDASSLSLVAELVKYRESPDQRTEYVAQLFSAVSNCARERDVVDPPQR